MCQEKKEEEDSPALKLASIHQYEDLKTTLKKAKKNWLQRPETTQESTEQQ